MYAGYANNPTISLVAYASTVSSSDLDNLPSNSTTSGNDTAEADADPTHSLQLPYAGNLEAGNLETGNYDVVHEGSQAWSMSGIDDPNSILAYTPSVGQVEAAQWQN